MASPYKKNQKPSTKEGGKKSRFLLMLLSFISGYFVAGIYDMQHLNQWVNHQITAFKQDKHPASQVHNMAKKADIPKPKFEFYTSLAHDEQRNKANSTPVTHQATVTEAQPAVTNHLHHQYLLQVASYKTTQDAERAKAELTLKGYDVRVVKVTASNGTWYRLMLGPFPDKSGAEKAQSMVARSEHVLGMIKTVEVS